MGTIAAEKAAEAISFRPVRQTEWLKAVDVSFISKCDGNLVLLSGKVSCPGYLAVRIIAARGRHSSVIQQVPARFLPNAGNGVDKP